MGRVFGMERRPGTGPRPAATRVRANTGAARGQGAPGEEPLRAGSVPALPAPDPFTLPPEGSRRDLPPVLSPVPSARTPGVSSLDDGVAAEEMGYLFDGADAAPPAESRGNKRAGEALGELLTQSRLAGMADGGVRQMLARKLCRLLPDLPADGRDAATRVALKALEQLARDHAEHVRAALASSIKDVACAPPSVVRTLARDIERSVAEPVLRYCVTLTDADLLEIIAARGETWALAAVARRAHVSAPVSEAIIDTGDAAATGVLLDNDGAVIAEPALERLVEDAARRGDWHDKLARNRALPPHLAVRLAQFVDQSVVAMLRRREDFDDETISDIADTVRRRVDWIETRAEGETAESRAIRLHRQDRLDETAIGDALSWEETGFVEAALSLRAAIPPAVVGRILSGRNPRAVTALVWRAGLSMRCAMQIQARAAGIPPSRMLNARQGTAYPLSADEMMAALALYGVG